MSCDSPDPKVPPPPRQGAGTLPASATEIDSVTLMAGRRELLIRHAQALYRLRVTAQGKLILTK